MPTVAIPRKTTTATTTTPISQAVNVESLSGGTEVGGTEVEEAMLELPVVWRMEVEPAAKVVVELPVAWGTGVDSRPPWLPEVVVVGSVGETSSCAQNPFTIEVADAMFVWRVLHPAAATEEAADTAAGN